MPLGTNVNAVYRNMDIGKSKLYFAVSLVYFQPCPQFTRTVQAEEHYSPCRERCLRRSWYLIRKNGRSLVPIPRRNATKHNFTFNLGGTLLHPLTRLLKKKKNCLSNLLKNLFCSCSVILGKNDSIISWPRQWKPSLESIVSVSNFPQSNYHSSLPWRF